MDVKRFLAWLVLIVIFGGFVVWLIAIGQLIALLQFIGVLVLFIGVVLAVFWALDVLLMERRR